MIATKFAPGLVAAAALLAAATPAFAQAPSPATTKFFVNANVGGQLASRTFDTSATKTVYEEPASLKATYPIGTGVLFDFGGGYRVFGDVYVGVTVSSFSKTGDAKTDAVIPDTVVFGRPKAVPGTATGLKHSEMAIIPQIIWAYPLTGKLDLAAGIGPAFVRLSQDVVSSFTVPDRTQNVTPVITTQTGNGTGVAATLDLTYGINDRIGIGGFARFAPAKVQLDATADKVNVGGMQAGAGIRLRF